MNRTILAVAGVFGTSSLLLVDSAIKGTALLLLAALATVLLRRDSAATRHLVWLLAIVAMLVVPILSALLPQWRALPAWASVAQVPVVVAVNSASIAGPAEEALRASQNREPIHFVQPAATADQPAAEMPDSRSLPTISSSILQSGISPPDLTIRDFLNALPLVWMVGFCLFILRLTAARMLLWNTERRGTLIGSSGLPAQDQPAQGQPAQAPHDTLVTSLQAACAQLRIVRPVTLLLHPDKTIPVVWGILRCRLLLPKAARQWSDEQLRSVLLHELAHVQRRDMLAQLLTQLACALYWFNPLVWLAAWRMGVERERACDDLVLSSGVRPSAYAGHLLDVATGLSPARWTTACGLAMARKSSLEGRLVAVLGENLNRRSLSVPLAAIGLVIAVGVAVPLAMLRAADRGLHATTEPAIDSQAATQAGDDKALQAPALEFVSVAGHGRSAMGLRRDGRFLFGLYSRGQLTLKKPATDPAGFDADGLWKIVVLQQSNTETIHQYELQYAREKPDQLLINGREFEVGWPERADPASFDGKGLWFVLTNYGRAVPKRWHEWITLADLDAPKQYTWAWYLDHDIFEAEIYRSTLEMNDLKNVVLAWDVQHPQSHSDGARVAKLRVLADGRVVACPDGPGPLSEIRLAPAELSELLDQFVHLATVKQPVGNAPANEAKAGQAPEPDAQAADAKISRRDFFRAHQDLVTVTRRGTTHFTHVIHRTAKDPVGEVPGNWDEVRRLLNQTIALTAKQPPAGERNAIQAATPAVATAVAVPAEKIVAGRVIGALDLPVKNAEVGLQVWGYDEQDRLPDSDFVATARTDADGSFRITVPATIIPKQKIATIWVLAEGYIPVRPTDEGGLPEYIGETVTIRLLPARETVIRVMAQDGSPAPGVRVRVSSQRLPESIGWPTPRRWTDRLQGVTNEQGEAHLAHTLPDAIDGIILSRTGMADIWLDANYFLNIRPAKSGPAFEFRLPPTGGIDGRLVVEGAALPKDLTMRIQTRSQLVNAPNLDAWGQADASVDADGRFQVTGIATGHILILPFLPADQPLRAVIPPNIQVRADTSTTLNIPVAKGVLVRGQIRKMDTQAGAAKVHLRLIYGQSARDHTKSFYETFELVTDKAGRFSAFVPPGPIDLRLQSVVPGYRDIDWWNPENRGRWGTRRDVPAGQAEFDLQPIDLDPSKPLQGRLVDAAGEPLADWTVYGYPDLPNKPRDESRMNSFGGVDTDSEGKFKGTYPVSLPPAWWNVSHRDWPTPYEFDDNKWDAKVLSTEPFVLQVPVRKADVEQGSK